MENKLTQDQLHKSRVFRLKWKQVLNESVKDRPAMPETLCLKLVQSLIDDCVPYDAKIGVVDSTPILALQLKEAGFTNLTCLNNSQAKYSKPTGRVWLDDVKGFCTNNKIGTLMFNLDMSNEQKFDVIIGNPPYGHAAGLAIKFLNKAFDLSDDVRFVLPMSISRVHCMNRIRLDVEPVSTERLPDDTFPSNIQACYQIWTKGKREKVPQPTKHADWTWLPYEERASADLIIRISGTNAGLIITKDEDLFDLRKEAGNNHFIKVINDEVTQRFVNHRKKLIEMADTCNGRGKANRGFVVDFYSNHTN